MEKLLLTVGEAAELTGIGLTKAYELIRKGEWPSIRIGRILRVPVRELQEWVDKRSAETREERAARASADLGWWLEQRR